MPSYIATNTGQSEPELGFRRMGTLICDVCGERFAIDHPADVADKNLAAKQADWLGKVLAYDHECHRARPHCGHVHTAATLMRMGAGTLQCDACKRPFASIPDQTSKTANKT